MAQTACVIVSGGDRDRLEAIAADRNRPAKHVERARVVLASAHGGPVQQIAARVGVSRPMVWRWQQRFAEAGVDGLLRDKTRKPGKPPVAAETVARVVALTCGAPPGEATHWTGRAMAKAAGISLRSVQRIWAAHKLQPHRVRSFKRSRDPNFAEKLVDIVGLYLDPPAQAVVLSIDEKSQIQALDRVLSRRLLEFALGASDEVTVSVQAARSIVLLAIGWPRDCQPSTLRMVICPEASSAQNSIAAVSAEGSTVCVLMRRLNSSCSRSIAFVVRADFHWLGCRRVKANSRSPASSRLVATAPHRSRHFLRNALRFASTSCAVAA
jgi:hypothetical protein